MFKVQNYLYLSAFFVILIFLILFPQKITFLTSAALTKCSKVIIPSIFPFAVITQVLTRTGISTKAGMCMSHIISPVIGIPKELCGAFITGIFGGFPGGAHATGIVYSQGLCTDKEAERCVALSNGCSIPFLISVCGIYTLGSIKNGLFLMISQFITVIITAQILKFIQRIPYRKSSIHIITSPNITSGLSSVICQSITEACSITLNVCGFITVFYILSGLLSNTFNMPMELRALISGAMEITSGSDTVKLLNFPENFIIYSVISGFTGISVILQVTDAASKYGISANEFIFSRFINAVVTPVVTAILLLICPLKAITVFNYTSEINSNERISLWNTITVYALLFALVMISLYTVYAASIIIQKHTENKILKNKKNKSIY